MKVSNINARVDKAGKHNDRNFDVSRSDHIDPGKSAENRYWTYNGDKDHSFKDVEIGFYKEHFGEHLRKQTALYKSRGQTKKIKNAKAYQEGVRSRPEDKILQIGNIDEHASADVLWECALDYQKRFDEKYGDRCKILDMALHVDEATPHVHVRRVWIGHDKNGDECVGQEKALTELGILPPDAEKPISRYNNRKMTFTYEDQEMFREIARERGIEVEEPTHERQQHLPILEYKKQRVTEDLEREREAVAKLKEEEEQVRSAVAGIKEMGDKTAEAMEDFLLHPVFHDEYDDEVEELRKKKEWERVEKLAQMTKQATENLPEIVKIPDDDLMREQVHLKKKLRAAERVIKDHHLEKAYKKERHQGREERRMVL